MKITKDHKTCEIVINTENKVQGRSIYVCKNVECIENALKKKRIETSLKSKMPENIKQELYTVLTN
ncbi:YlxR family protein [bacterium]|nr:YlxR family protein [bacterium]